jgi:hypothetical protein
MLLTRVQESLGMATIAVALAACGGGEAASVEITEPATDAEIVGSEVTVILAATGVEIAPVAQGRRNTAHHHLFIDRDLTPLGDVIPADVDGIVHLGGGQTEYLISGLGPGPHRVIAVLADVQHLPLRPVAVDPVEFTIQP